MHSHPMTEEERREWLRWWNVYIGGRIHPRHALGEFYTEEENRRWWNSLTPRQKRFQVGTCYVFGAVFVGAYYYFVGGIISCWIINACSAYCLDDDDCKDPSNSCYESNYCRENRRGSLKSIGSFTTYDDLFGVVHEYCHNETGWKDHSKFLKYG